MKVLIGGGTGYVGRILSSALQRSGAQVTLLSRSPGPGRITWDSVETDGVPECDVVINTSGENVLNFSKRWTPDFEKRVFDSRIGRTKQLSTAVARMATPPKVFITTSGIGYYPTSHDAIYDETSAGGKGDYWASFSKEWEKSALLPDSVQTRHVSVRLAVVLGKNGGAYPQMRLPFFFGVGGKTGSGEQWFPWVHEDDLAGIYHHAINNEAIIGPVNCVSPESSTNSEFVSTLAEIMHRPAIFNVPGFIITKILGETRSILLLQGQNVKPKVALETGYQFKYPTLEASIKALES
eukprot:CFRG5980T1